MKRTVPMTSPCHMKTLRFTPPELLPATNNTARESRRFETIGPRGTVAPGEEAMLSAHEFAMLMLAKDAADHIAERKELDTLLENQLAAMEQLAGHALRL